MERKFIQLNRKEEKRALVIGRVISGDLTIREAAELLQLSDRQVKRLKKGVLEKGLEALAHGNRGRKPQHALSDETKEKVRELLQTKYSKANDVHVAELLASHDAIVISPSSVRRIRKEAGLPSARKRRPNKVHRIRPRRTQEGMLIQIDASSHAWLEERGPVITLVAAIDDATGKIVGALFRPAEDLEGYMKLMEGIVQQYGIPLAVYHDRHTIFQSPKTDKLTVEEELMGKQVPYTQFGRALQELSIQQIAARSPQAKGRIERLWETLQNRLPVEMRLANICSLEDANRFLPGFLERFNAKFAVDPTDSTPAYLPAPETDLKDIFCIHEQRKLKGGVLQYQGQTYRLERMLGLPKPPSTGIVAVIHRWDGILKARYNGMVYPLQPVNEKPTEGRQNRPEAEKKRAASPRKPSADHPWRRRAIPQKQVSV